MLQELSDEMPYKVVEDPRSRCESFNSTTPSSVKTKTTAVSVTDVNYRTSLCFRNIYIDQNDPPAELMRRATEVISQSRVPLGHDEIMIQMLRNKLRGIENATKGTITLYISFVTFETLDRRLRSAASQLWFDAVPVPLDPEVFTDQPRLHNQSPTLLSGIPKLRSQIDSLPP